MGERDWLGLLTMLVELWVSGFAEQKYMLTVTCAKVCYQDKFSLITSCLDIRKEIFIGEAQAAQKSCGCPSLKVCKARLEGLGETWSGEKVSLTLAGHWNWLSFKVPPTKLFYHSVILSFIIWKGFWRAELTAYVWPGRWQAISEAGEQPVRNRIPVNTVFSEMLNYRSINFLVQSFSLKGQA